MSSTPRSTLLGNDLRQVVHSSHSWASVTRQHNLVLANQGCRQAQCTPCSTLAPWTCVTREWLYVPYLLHFLSSLQTVSGWCRWLTQAKAVWTWWAQKWKWTWKRWSLEAGLRSSWQCQKHLQMATVDTAAFSWWFVGCYFGRDD